MQGMTLSLKKDNKVAINVGSKDIIEYMKPIIPQIEAYLQKALGNRNISVGFAMQEEEQQKVLYNPNKLFKQMLKENPALEALNSQLGLRID